jgi:hypothetical protein
MKRELLATLEVLLFGGGCLVLLWLAKLLLIPPGP